MKNKYLDLSGTELKIQGHSISRLVDRAGGTPLYIYDRNIIRQKTQELRAVFPSRIKLHYAIKANPMPALVGFIKDYVDGFDVASSFEMQTALNAGIKSQDISFAGPGKTDSEIKQALAAGVLLNTESLNEIKRIIKIAQDQKYTPRFSIRINPQFEMKSSGMKMSGGSKPFGIDSEAVPEVIDHIDKAGYQLEGFHIYSGSQNLNADIICESQNKTLQMLLQIKPFVKSNLLSINLGGGFGIPYFEGEQDLDIQKIGKNLGEIEKQLHDSFPQAEVVIELGRYLVGESGLYVAQIVDKKISREQIFLVVDGGMNHHLAASGNLGQVIKKNYPIVIANKLNGSNQEAVTIAGPLCTPLDLLAQNIQLPQCEAGDYVAVLQSGAYGVTASPKDFLSHPHPKEILV